MRGIAAPGTVARWLKLTREALPAMAVRHNWPIVHDHCFMRVCLDMACGRPWHDVIQPPAIRHATEDQLERAIAVAERIVSSPHLLPHLNADSLVMRKRGLRPPAKVAVQEAKPPGRRKSLEKLAQQKE